MGCVQSITHTSQQLNSKQIVIEDYDIVNLWQLYQNPQSTVTVNLIAYIGDPKIPYYVQKQFVHKDEYEKEKQIYTRIGELYQQSIEDMAIMMQSHNDEKNEIYFSYGKCTLLDLAEHHKAKEKLVPSQLVKLSFKVMAQMINKLYDQKLFYTDIKPENLVLESFDQLQPQRYHLKFIDFGSLSSEIQVRCGFTEQYYTSNRMLSKTKDFIVKFDDPEERLYNEYFTLFRTLQKILYMNNSKSEDLFQECKAQNHIEEINQQIQTQYQPVIQQEQIKDKSIKKIFEFMDKMTKFNRENSNDYKQISDFVKEIVEEIDIKEYQDTDNQINQITTNKFNHKVGKINPLETLLSINCMIELCGSKYPNQQTSERLEKILSDFLNDGQKRIYLLLGKSGSGKSLFLRKYYTQLNREEQSDKNPQKKNLLFKAQQLPSRQ